VLGLRAHRGTAGGAATAREPERLREPGRAPVVRPMHAVGSAGRRVREARITLTTLTRTPTTGTPLVITLNAGRARRVGTLGTEGIAIAAAERSVLPGRTSLTLLELAGDSLRDSGLDAAPSLGPTGPLRRLPRCR
jgi:hypothetical protein